jgi:hypothetical protein
MSRWRRRLDRGCGDDGLSGGHSRDLRRELGLALLDDLLQRADGRGMIGVDGDDLPQEFFTLGVVMRDGAQPQPGRFVARLGDDDHVEDLPRAIFQSALGSYDALGKQVFGVHAE